jgi:hypothetical protein
LTQNYSLARCSSIHSHSRLRASFGAPGSALFFVVDDDVADEEVEIEIEDVHDDEVDEVDEAESITKKIKRTSINTSTSRHTRLISSAPPSTEKAADTECRGVDFYS